MDDRSPTAGHKCPLDDAETQRTPDHHESRLFSSSSAALSERTTSDDKIKRTPTALSDRSNHSNLPVLRLFSTTPQGSRLRRTSSPLRTTVTLDFQSSPIEECKTRSASSVDQWPDRAEGRASISKPFRRSGSLLICSQQLERKGGSSSGSRDASNARTARSLMQTTPDKENLHAGSSPDEAGTEVLSNGTHTKPILSHVKAQEFLPRFF
jgi:hypothetical protein